MPSPICSMARFEARAAPQSSTIDRVSRYCIPTSTRRIRARPVGPTGCALFGLAVLGIQRAPAAVPVDENIRGSDATRSRVGEGKNRNVAAHHYGLFCRVGLLPRLDMALHRVRPSVLRRM